MTVTETRHAGHVPRCGDWHEWLPFAGRARDRVGFPVPEDTGVQNQGASPQAACAVGAEAFAEAEAANAAANPAGIRLPSELWGAADLRVLTAFRHHEHVDPLSSNDELVREATDFRVTYLIDDRWVAGIENLRMPVALPDGFGPRESMSLFLYNQDGNQALARVFLDGRQTVANQTDHPPGSAPGIPRMNVFRTEDTGTNAPTQHFIYDFEYYHFRVCARWREVLSHDERGGVVAGSFADLATAVAEGREVKVGIRGLCADVGGGLDHEVFVHVGPCYEYASSRFLVGATHPAVRVRPAVPLAYRSGAWDFGWLIARTDGLVSRWLCDPRTLKFTKSGTRHAIRWFTDAG